MQNKDQYLDLTEYSKLWDTDISQIINLSSLLNALNVFAVLCDW